MQEWDRCAQSPLYFLKTYGKIRDKNKGIIPFTAPAHIVSFSHCLRTHRFIIVLKAKQIYMTWYMGGDNLHLANFKEGANILTLSKGEDEATESLDYSRFTHSQLPSFLYLPFGKDQSSLITIPSMHSKIRALPSTEDAGVGFGGATRVVMDEFEYHRYDRQNYSEILPPILDGGQLVILSTADKLKTNTLFKELYIAAKAGDNNFYPIFFPYDVLPNRTQEWYDAIDLPPSAKECRFPRTEDEALSTLGTRKFFDPDILESRLANCKELVGHELSDKYRGLVKIFCLPVVGRKYCGFTDPSDGKDDPHASIFIDQVTGEQVAESHGKVTADLCAQIHDDLVRLYNKAFNSYEVNSMAGGKFAETIKSLDTPSQCQRVQTDGTLDKKHYGWWTGKNLKRNMIWGLEEVFRTGQFTPHSKELLREFNQYIQPEGEEPQATSGAHDDYVMACGGVFQIRKHMRTGDMGVTSCEYRD